MSGEQVLDIPIGKGLAEGFDAKILPFGNAAKLENFESLRTGGITKRKGLAAPLAMVDLSGNQLDAPRRMDAFHGSLRTVCTALAAGLPGLFVYSPALDAWAGRDSLAPCSLERQTIATSTDLQGASVAPFGGGRFLLVVWSDGSVNDILWRVVDAASGAVLRQTAVLGAFLGAFARLVPVGDDCWIVFDNGSGSLVGRRVSGVDLSTSDLTIDAASPATFDANSFGTTELVVCWNRAPAGSVLRFARIVSSTATVAHSGTYAAAGSIYAIAVAGSSTDGVQALYKVGTSAPIDLSLVRMTPTLSGVAGGPYAIETALTWVGNSLAVELDSSTTWCAYESSTVSIDRGALRVKSVSGGGTVAGARESYRLALLSGLRKIGDRVFCLALAPQDKLTRNNGAAVTSGGLVAATYTAGSGITASTTGGSEVAHALLLCVDDPATADLLVCGKVGTVTPYLSPAGDKGGPKLWQASTDVWTVALCWREGSQAPSNVDAASFDFAELQPRLHHAEAAGPLYLSGGGLVTSNDGTCSVEISFPQAPCWDTPVVAAEVGPSYLASSPSGIAYAYRARYEWPDDKGQIHVSPWSPDLVVTLIDAASGTYSVQLTVICTDATRRGRNLFGSYRQPRIALYRSTGNGASPSGDIVYYRLAEWENLPQNSAFSQTFTDDLSDADLLALGLGQAVSPGDTLAPICPPASAHLCAHRGRLWLASAESGRDVWASLPLLPGEQPRFPPEFRVSLGDAPDAITALASLDDKLVIFTATRIYYLTGDGPADNGSGESWPQPWLVTAQHGCIDSRSLVTTPEGVFFQTSAGIALLNRGLQVTLAGESIRDLIESHQVCLAATHDPNRSRALWLLANASGETIGAVYDYLHQVWSRRTIDGLSERVQTLWGDFLVVGAQGVARSEQVPASAYFGQDLNDGDEAAWVTGVFETPWICPGGAGAYQRMRRLILVGSQLGFCKLRVEVYLNFDDGSSAQSHEIVLDNASVVSGLPLLRYEVPLNVQASQAIKIRLTDLAPTDVGEVVVSGNDPRTGIALVRMALEYLPERGTPRLPATNRGGGT